MLEDSIQNQAILLKSIYDFWQSTNNKNGWEKVAEHYLKVKKRVLELERELDKLKSIIP